MAVYTIVILATRGVAQRLARMVWDHEVGGSNPLTPRLYIERTKINPEEIGDVLTGCTMQMAEQWLYGGRLIAMLADLPINVPAQGVERVCCSGMSAMHTGVMEIAQGYSDIVFACSN